MERERTRSWRGGNRERMGADKEGKKWGRCGEKEEQRTSILDPSQTASA